MTEEPKRNRAQPPSRDPLRLIIETFGIATGGAFLLSATTHGFAFRRLWGLNFFQIATPTDVLMGGFVAVAIIAVPTLLVVALSYASCWIAERTNFLPHATQLFGRYAAVSVIGFGFMLFVVGANPWLDLPRREGTVPGYFTGLRVANESEVPDRCKGAGVLWLGSSSAVLNCQGRVVVIHTLDGVVTEAR